MFGVCVCVQGCRLRVCVCVLIGPHTNNIVSCWISIAACVIWCRISNANFFRFISFAFTFRLFRFRFTELFHFVCCCFVFILVRSQIQWSSAGSTAPSSIYYKYIYIASSDLYRKHFMYVFNQASHIYMSVCVCVCVYVCFIYIYIDYAICVNCMRNLSGCLNHTFFVPPVPDSLLTILMRMQFLINRQNVT